MIEPYYESESGSVTLICADVLDALREMADESVHCVVTSPPYDNLRTYEGHTWDFEAIAHELYRVLVNGGIMCWVVGDATVDGSETLTSMRQAIYFKDVVGFRVHDTMIYEKTNAAFPEHSRYHQIFEYIFVLSKDRPRCFNPIKDKVNVYAGSGTFGINTQRQRNGVMVPRKCNIIAPFGMRGNVWLCKTAGQENICKPVHHPAQMPYGLARDLVLSWSNPGDTILDPMAGSGTTLLAAMKHDRKAVGIEISEKYCGIAVNRLGLGLVMDEAKPDEAQGALDYAGAGRGSG